MSDLQEAVAVIRAGDRQAGRRLLAEILAREPDNETAWLWMSGVVEQDEQRQYCLKQILKRNPRNTVARAALDRLQASTAEVAPAPAGVPAEPERDAGPVRGWQPEETRAGVESRPTAERAPVWEAPPVPARDPALTKNMADFVTAKIIKHESVDDIVLKLCEVSGMSWQEAREFVERVEKERRPEIVSRRRPILLVVGAMTLLVGGYLAYTSASYLADFVSAAGTVAENPWVYALSTPGLLRRVITLAIGMAVVVGGLWGTVRALLPPGDRSSLESGVEGAAGGGIRSIDDVMGVDIRVGGQSAASSRRQGRRGW